MFEEITSRPLAASAELAYKTLMMFTKQEIFAGLALELYRRDKGESISKTNLESVEGILALLRGHVGQYDSAYAKPFPARWYDEDFVDMNELENYFMFKAKDLVAKVIPKLVEEHTH
jgi:hypothetical protein